MGRWIGILLAETGSSTDPGALHYDYIDVEMSANVIQTAKHNPLQYPCLENPRDGEACWVPSTGSLN